MIPSRPPPALLRQGPLNAVSHAGSLAPRLLFVSDEVAALPVATRESSVTERAEARGGRGARRRFTAEDKQRILEAIDARSERGEASALLRAEGLSWSHVAKWRRQRDEGELEDSWTEASMRRRVDELVAERRELLAEREELRRLNELLRAGRPHDELERSVLERVLSSLEQRELG